MSEVSLYWPPDACGTTSFPSGGGERVGAASRHFEARARNTIRFYQKRFSGVAVFYFRETSTQAFFLSVLINKIEKAPVFPRTFCVENIFEGEIIFDSESGFEVTTDAKSGSDSEGECEGGVQQEQ